MATRSIYLVLDMMNDIVHPDGPNGKGFGAQAAERGIIPKTRATIAKARAAGVRIGFVRVGFSADYREAPAPEKAFSRFVRARKAGIFKLGGWGTEVHEALRPAEGDFDFVKHRVSPFFGTNLDLVLRANGIERIYLSGVSTNAVVQATVREGHDRDYECILIEDCCSAASAEEHAQAVATLASFCAVTTSDKVAFA